MLSCLLDNQQICSLDLKDKYNEYIIEKLEYVKEASQNKRLICEECGDVVILRAGNYKVPYFAHKNKNELCYWETHSKKETEEHIKGKSIIYQYFKEKYHEAEAKVNYRHQNGKRSDVFIVFKNYKQLAIEFLREDMKITEWKEKHDFYKNNDINDIWLLSTKEYKKENVKNISIDFFEKFLAYRSNDDIIKFLNTENETITLIRKIEFKGLMYFQELFIREYKIQDVLIDEDGNIECDFKNQFDKAYSSFNNRVEKLEEIEKKARVEKGEQKIWALELLNSNNKRSEDKEVKKKVFEITEEQEAENKEYVKNLIQQLKAKRNRK